MFFLFFSSVGRTTAETLLQLCLHLLSYCDTNSEADEKGCVSFNEGMVVIFPFILSFLSLSSS